jgi:Peptidase A4 family
MSPKQRILRAAATAALALATTVAMTLPAGAATAPTSLTHATVTTAASRPHTTFGPSTSSQYWAGYLSAESAGFFTTITATFQLPNVASCSSASGSADDPAIGVGIDDTGASTGEFAGFGGYCGPIHIVWPPCLPHCPDPWSGSLGNPGDQVSVTVNYLSGDEFNSVVHDLTQGWTYSADYAVSGAERASAEAIVADTNTATLVPLKNFGAVAFQGITVNGSEPLYALTPTPITMVSTSGVPMAIPSAITSSGFSVTWESPGP